MFRHLLLAAVTVDTCFALSHLKCFSITILEGQNYLHKNEPEAPRGKVIFIFAPNHVESQSEGGNPGPR